MTKIALFLILLFALAVALAWLADNPGTVAVEWPYANARVDLSLMEAVIFLGVIVATLMIGWWLITGVLNSPKTFGRWRQGRVRDKGYAALSQGLIAANAGNAPKARKLTKESAKYLKDEPLVAMLDAQTALLEGDRAKARETFEAMLDNDSTRLLGLRGLHVEAEREGAGEAAAHFANEAAKQAPETPWATQAVLRGYALAANWKEALRVLEANRNTGMFDQDEFKTKKAVILTALAQQAEAAEPDRAKAHGLAALKLKPGFAPAAVVTARVLSRLGDLRKAAKVLETCWKDMPHPEVADTYVHLRLGDSSEDRLKRAIDLNTKRAHNVEGQYVLAKAAIDAQHFDEARNALKAILRNETTERACLLMADIEEAEHGDRGRVREWLTRAVTASRDPLWVADGIAKEEWSPCSPVTGRIGAFEWKVPVDERSASLENRPDYSQLTHQTPHETPTPATPSPVPVSESVSDNQDDDGADMKVISPKPEEGPKNGFETGTTKAPKEKPTASSLNVEGKGDQKAIDANMTAASAAAAAAVVATSTKNDESDIIDVEPENVTNAGDAKAGPASKTSHADGGSIEDRPVAADNPSKAANVSSGKTEPVQPSAAPSKQKPAPLPEAQAVGFMSKSTPSAPDALGTPERSDTRSDADTTNSDGKPQKAMDQGSGDNRTGPNETENTSKTKSAAPRAPFKGADLDTDEDGILDRRPDDPGIVEAENEPRRGLLF
ncbi:MAG: heme biosynthesis HemY N-terminal domain-containing protein [Pseudomonadota bacterium]